MQYYYLITGLTRRPLDAPIASVAARLREVRGGEGFDVPAIRDRIKKGLSARDVRAVELLERYNALSSTEEYEPFFQEFEQGSSGIGIGRGGIASVMERWPEYLVRWIRADRTIRNLTAAWRAKSLGWDLKDEHGVRSMLMGLTESEKERIMADPKGAGYELRLPCMDELVKVWETEDFVQREQQLDALRWHVADHIKGELRDYFGIGTVLCYLIQLDLLHRWVALDAQYGREVFRAMVESLVTIPAQEKAQEEEKTE